MMRWWVGPGCAVLTVLMAVILPATAGAATAAFGTAGPPQARPLTHTHPLMGTDAQSLNWSGYDVTGGPFTTVTATWTQPKVLSSGAAFSDSAFWVGLDGDGSNTVEQIGTEGYSEGAVGYDAWYEMYPAAPVTIDMAIRPGDVLTGTVAWTSSAEFTLSLVNHTTGVSFAVQQTMNVPPALASAEIIAEAPSSSSGVVQLANFTLCDFSACTIDEQPISSYDWTRIGMINQNGSPLDVTLPLGADGASFAVSTDVTPPMTFVEGGVTGWHSTPVTLDFTATDGLGSGVAYTEYSLDGGTTWTQGNSVTIAAPADHSADGPHRVLYRSVDNVGNVEPAQTCKVRIDTRSPTPQAPRAASVLEGHTATLHYSVNDPRPGSPWATVTIVLRKGNGALVRKTVLRHCVVDTPLVYRFVCKLERGSYTFTVAATDSAGNRQTALASNSLAVH